jgi:putative toxin-antitoxin system antitoxin component (TIGR02293 family)
MQKPNQIKNKALFATYDSADDKEVLGLINIIKAGISFAIFIVLVDRSPFALDEWSGFLRMSPRTMQRYKKDKRSFDPIYGEKILQLTLLNNLGTDIFGSKEKFNAWLEAKNLALGKIKPKELLDTSFGIDLLRNELTRIEYGVLA